MEIQKIYYVIRWIKTTRMKNEESPENKRKSKHYSIEIQNRIESRNNIRKC